MPSELMLPCSTACMEWSYASQSMRMLQQKGS